MPTAEMLNAIYAGLLIGPKHSDRDLTSLDLTSTYLTGTARCRHLSRWRFCAQAAKNRVTDRGFDEDLLQRHVAIQSRTDIEGGLLPFFSVLRAKGQYMYAPFLRTEMAQLLVLVVIWYLLIDEKAVAGVL